MTSAINHLAIEDRNNEIRAARKTGRTMADIGRQYGISKQMVNAILGADTAYPLKKGAEVERELKMHSRLRQSVSREMGLGRKAGPATLYTEEEVGTLRVWCNAHTVCSSCGGAKKMLARYCTKCSRKYKNKSPEQKKKHYDIVMKYRANKRLTQQRHG